MQKYQYNGKEIIIPDGWEPTIRDDFGGFINIDGININCNDSGYFIQKDSGVYDAYAFIPYDMNDSTSITEYNPGTAGFSDDWQLSRMKDHLNTDNIILFNAPKDGSDVTTVTCQSLQDAYNLKSKTINTIGYSAGYEIAIKEAAERARLGIPQDSVILIDGRKNQENTYFVISDISSDDVQILKENNVSFILYEDSEALDHDTRVENQQILSEKVGTVIVLESDNDHGMQRNSAVQNGLFEGIDYSNYNIRVYENGELLSESEAKAKITNIASYSDSEITKYDFITNFLDSFKTSINNFSIINSRNIGNETYGSKALQVANELFSKYAIDDLNFLNSLSTAGNNISEIAKAISDMDRNLALLVNGDVPLDRYDYDNFISQPFEISGSTGYANSDNCKLKISKSDIYIAMSDNNPIIKSLMNDITETQKVIGNLMDFVEAPDSALSGSEWDEMKNKITELEEYANKKIIYAKGMIEALRSSYQNILNFMEEYDVLDTSIMEQLKETIKHKKARITALEFNIATIPDYEYDEDGELIADNTAKKAAWRAEVQKLTEEVKEHERHYAKLEELPSIDAAAADNIISLTGAGPELPVINAITTANV